MGKKRIVKKGGEGEASGAGGSPRASKRKMEKGLVYVEATYNNTKMCLADEGGNIVVWSSAGSLGFSGAKKGTPFAAAKVVSALAEKIQKSGPFNVHVFLSGVGGGRDSALRSFANRGFTILSIKDVTPIPHNGPRPKKVRRV